MDNKRKIMNSTKVCRYGDKCYRKNPEHLIDFFHSHLQKILDKGVNPTSKEYEIPDEYSLQSDIIIEQLGIMEAAKSPNKSKDEPPKKVPKIEKNISISSISDDDDDMVVVTKPRTSIKPSTPKIHQSKLNFKNALTPKIENNSICLMSDDDDDDLTIVNPPLAKTPQIKKVHKVSTPEQKPSTSSAQPSTNGKLDLKQQMSNFFKERKESFKGKTNMEASTSSTPSKSFANKSPSAAKFHSSPDIDAKIRECFSVVLPRHKMAEKLKKAAPYNFFLTTIAASKETHNEPLSITFQELLDPSLGEIESSVQINFMVDIGWLLAHYHLSRNKEQPILILYGSDSPELSTIHTKKPNVTAVQVKINTPYGCHHTKMMLFFYKDRSMRVVVSTANLYEDDWENRVQGMWISDRLPELSEGQSFTSHGESVTKFREDLMRYLIAYNIPKLQPVVARIRNMDFSKVNVFFVASVPGSHREMPGRGFSFGHPRLAKLLSEHSAPVDDACPIIAQSSSIGNLGPNAQSYILSEIAISMRKDSAPVGLRKVPQFKLVYPTFNNVKNSYDGLIGGGGLPYGKAAHDKQPWLNSHLCQWRSNSRNRNRAMPHIKSYCRYSDRGLYWFHLSSANMSKSAWGVFNKSSKLEAILRINSYEAGVLFMPKIMIDKNYFPMNEAQRKDNNPVFQLPFDVPLLPYVKDDTPFLMDYLNEWLKARGR
ncbi:unnamed protein product [Diamesa hyperborea]